MMFASRTQRSVPPKKFSRRLETSFAESRSWESGQSRSIPNSLVMHFNDLTADEVYHAFKTLFNRFGYPKLTWIVETR